MSDATVKSKKPIYKKWWFWVIVVFVLFVIGSSGSKPSSTTGTDSSGQTTHSNSAPQEQAIVVTATKIFADYQANEISADNTYKGKLIEVTGTVDNIGKDILDTPYISLKTGDLIGTVQCMLDDSAVAEAGTMSEGTKVTLRGRVDSKLGNVIVRGCTLAK